MVCGGGGVDRWRVGLIRYGGLWGGVDGWRVGLIRYHGLWGEGWMDGG